MVDEHVQVDGINQLISSFNKVSRDLSKQIQAQLKLIADKEVGEVKATALSKGLGAPGYSGRGTGKLVDSIRSSVRGGSAYIRETALKNGYKYPAVYEFGRTSRWQRTHGVREFMLNTLERDKGSIIRDIQHVLDFILSDEFK